MPVQDGGADAPRPVTIYDVAQVAGVAPSTVSRAFSRPGRVNARTAERIRGIAATLGYRTRPLAGAVHTAPTRMIALVVADIANPVFAAIVRGAQEAASERGYLLLLADAQEDDRRERAAVERALPSVDGIVLASPRMSDSAIRMMAKQKPVVVLNRAIPDVPCVMPDYANGLRQAAEHLSALGHGRVTYVAGPVASWADGTRWRSLRAAATHLPLAVRRIGPFPPDVDGGARAAVVFAAQPTSAVIAYNDQLAIGLLRGLTQMGVRVPGEVSVVGFDNILAADLVTPGLTTVAAPLHTEGAEAIRHLLAMVEGAGSRTGQPLVLPTRLVVRGTTARIASSVRPPSRTTRAATATTPTTTAATADN
jgi:LacI family transcriptional regulator, repressor for deo operon, udp, cdd, tsx, nupC, and nupG